VPDPALVTNPWFGGSIVKSAALIVTCMLISDWSNVLLKLGAMRDEFAPTVPKILGLATNPYFVVGLFLYIIGMVLWLTVLAQHRFSTATMLFSLHYLHLMVLSRWVFHEPIRWNMWAGTILIVAGVAMFALPGPQVAQP
jgi:drug/metabolite transporter (DMT)-like permease